MAVRQRLYGVGCPALASEDWWLGSGSIAQAEQNHDRGDGSTGVRRLAMQMGQNLPRLTYRVRSRNILS